MPTIQMAYSDSIAVSTVRIVRFVSDKGPRILVKHSVRIISIVLAVRRYLRNLKGTDRLIKSWKTA